MVSGNRRERGDEQRAGEDRLYRENGTKAEPDLEEAAEDRAEQRPDREQRGGLREDFCTGQRIEDIADDGARDHDDRVQQPTACKKRARISHSIDGASAQATLAAAYSAIPAIVTG